MPLGVLTLAFDPVVRLGDTSSVRVETIGLAVVLFLGLLLAARIGSLTPAVGPYVPAPGLRLDDLVFIVVGAVPGAVAGGRLGYVLDHLDYYGANPGAIVDPTQGGLTLTLAVPLGILSGAFIARLLGAPVARWFHASAL
ncbi:MAG: prolipoprotein diacylglyceryl transferase, partial [Chloroflexi bacterium]|nr:prolipoprotein diacylglyceryl transferase [Chloroflexota bacterium]